MRFEVQNGSFSYKKDSSTVLNNISFEIDEGDTLAILGPNGAGKTTLLRCCLGLLSWNDGKSLLDGKNIKDIPYKELWKKISYVPQARNVSSAASVYDMIMIGRTSSLGIFSNPGEKDFETVDKLIERFSLHNIKDRSCSEISGGELQMVLIARALASNPGILVLDEPESNLDFKNQLIVMETISQLSSDGITCIFNTHYPTHAMQRANKALLLSPGGNWKFGNTYEIVTENALQNVFGVKAVISEVETPVNITKSIVPIMVADSPVESEHVIDDERHCLATISIIFSSGETGGKVDAILHEYNSLLIGRMGMPYPECGVKIININIDAKKKQIDKLTSKLSVLPGISVKATFSKELF